MYVLVIYLCNLLFFSFSAASLRPHKTTISHDRLSLYETATLNNTVLSSQDKLITVIPYGYGQAEYVGISLPLDITRLFEVLND